MAACVTQTNPFLTTAVQDGCDASSSRPAVPRDLNDCTQLMDDGFLQPIGCSRQTRPAPKRDNPCNRIVHAIPDIDTGGAPGHQWDRSERTNSENTLFHLRLR